MTTQIHQIEGQDPHRRVFNRQIELSWTTGGYQGRLVYEEILAESQPHRTVQEAITDIVHQLQKRGFQRLRTRLNFRGSRYLAEREPWIEYADQAAAGSAPGS
jgi:hypothetical protein